MGEIRYEGYETDPGSELMDRVEALHARIFDEERGPPLRDDLDHPGRSLLLVARDGAALVGYKLGYESSPGSFYSHLGGVDPEHRGRGIGAELMLRQHAWCREGGFRRVRTKTMNRWRTMLLLNLRHGFDIIGTERHRSGVVKIVMEKTLEGAAA